MNRKLIYESQFNNAYSKLLLEYETSIQPRKRDNTPNWNKMSYVGPRSDWNLKTSDKVQMSSNGYKSDPTDTESQMYASNAENQETNKPGMLSTLGHLALDVAGLIPGIGEPADLLNAAWYAKEGDYTNAALSAASAIPFAGYAATATKFGLKATDAVKTASTATKAVDAGADAARGIKKVENLAQKPIARNLPTTGGESVKIMVGGKPVDVKLNMPAKTTTRVPGTTPTTSPRPGGDIVVAPKQGGDIVVAPKQGGDIVVGRKSDNMPVPLPRSLPVPRSIPRSTPNRPTRTPTRQMMTDVPKESAPIPGKEGEQVGVDLKDLGILLSKADIANYTKSTTRNRQEGAEDDKTHGVAKQFLPNPQLWVSDLIRDQRGRASQYY